LKPERSQILSDPRSEREADHSPISLGAAEVVVVETPIRKRASDPSVRKAGAPA
jgi:hypothetical protein